MIKNYIPSNISYLVKKSNLSQDDFGVSFEVGRGLISNYINGKALPKIETIQRICLYFKITIDDFINTDLSEAKNYKQGSKDESLSEPAPGYCYVSLKYMELLEKSVEDKDKIIKALESKVEPDKSKTA